MKSRLARLVVVILIYSLVVVVASAQLAPPSSTQYGEGNIDFEDESKASNYYSSAKSGKFNVSGFSAVNGNHTKISVINGENNNYLRFDDNGAPSGTFKKNAYWELLTGPALQYEDGRGYYTDSYSASHYDFYVMEFDITSDSYLYTYQTADSTEGMTVDTALIPEGAEIVGTKLAYTENMRLSNVIETANQNDPNSYAQHMNSLMFVSDDSDWYVYAGCGENLINTGAKLEREISVWNHFTVVVEIVREQGSGIRLEQHTFLDGDHINTTCIGTQNDGFSELSSKAYRIELPNAQIMNKGKIYSFGIDNLSINYYMRSGSNYENAYSSDGFGLEEYFDAKDTAVGIYNCTDVVYNNSYVSESPMAYVDGVAYYSMNSALSAVRDGSVVRLLRGLDNYDPTVNSLTVITDGVKFSLKADRTDYSVQKSAENGTDTYIVTYVGSSTDPDGDLDELYEQVFDGAKYNLTTTTGFVGNFYVKVPADGCGYEVDIGEGSGFFGITAIEGERYYRFCSESAVGNVTAEIIFRINVTVGGETKTLEAQYTTDSYFLSAMQFLNQKADPTEDERMQKRLVMDATRYANELYKYVNSVSLGYTKYEEILLNEEYAENLTPYSELDIDEDAKIDFSGISSVVSGFGFAVNDGYSASYVLYVTDGNVDPQQIEVTYVSITGEIKENAIDPVLREYQNGGETLYYFACSDMPIYEMVAPQLVTVAFDGERSGSAYFTLPLYIANQSDSEAKALAKAMYAYARASYSFKISDNK